MVESMKSSPLISQLWNRLGHEAMWVISGQIIVALGGLVAIRMLTGFYPREVFGISWLFINGVTLAVTFLNGPFSQYLNVSFHECKQSQDQLDKLLKLIWTVETAVSLMAGLVYLLSVYMGGWLSGSLVVPFLILPVYFFFMSFLMAAKLLLNTSRRRAMRTVLLIVEAWLRPACAVVLAIIWGPDVRSFVIGYATATVLTGSVGIYLISGYGSVHPLKLQFPGKSMFSKAVEFSIPWAGYALLGLVLSLSDRYIIQIYRGAEATGTYIASYQVGSMLFQFIGGAMGALVQPILFHRLNVSEELGRDTITAIYSIIAWFGLPLTIFFVLTHGSYMRLLTAPEYWEGSKAAMYVGVGIFLQILGNFSALPFFVKRKTFLLFKVNLLVAIFNISFNIMFVPVYGYLAAAIVTMVSYGCFSALMITLSIRTYAWRLPLAALVRSGSLALMATAVATGIHSYAGMDAFGIEGFSVSFVVFIAFACLGVLIFKRNLLGDLDFLLKNKA